MSEFSAADDVVLILRCSLYHEDGVDLGERIKQLACDKYVDLSAAAGGRDQAW